MAYSKSVEYVIFLYKEPQKEYDNSRKQYYYRVISASGIHLGVSDKSVSFDTKLEMLKHLNFKYNLNDCEINDLTGE